MEGLEEKLGAVLSNPQMMQQLMSMAQNLSASTPGPKQESANEPAPSVPDIDLSTLQKISGMAKQSGIDKQQRALLNALCPYLSDNRIHKLEKAMQAAKMAKFASAAFTQGGLSFLTGR